jgi:hypothetical protein
MCKEISLGSSKTVQKILLSPNSVLITMNNMPCAVAYLVYILEASLGTAQAIEYRG